MAKKSNVHPDYYKTAGREPVGQSTVHEDHKRQFASAAKVESDGARRGKGRKPSTGRFSRALMKRPSAGMSPIKGTFHLKARLRPSATS